MTRSAASRARSMLASAYSRCVTRPPLDGRALSGFCTKAARPQIAFIFESCREGVSRRPVEAVGVADIVALAGVVHAERRRIEIGSNTQNRYKGTDDKMREHFRAFSRRIEQHGRHLVNVRPRSKSCRDRLQATRQAPG